MAWERTFVSEQDAALISKQQADMYVKSYPKIRFYFRPNDFNIDLLYSEHPEVNFTLWPYHEVAAFAKYTAQGATLKKFGVEEWRDIQVSLSIPLLQRLGIPLPTAGTVFAVQGEFYLVEDAFQIDKVGNTSIKMTMVVFGLKIRPSAIFGAENYPPNRDTTKTLFGKARDFMYLAKSQADVFMRTTQDLLYIDRDSDSPDFDVLYLEDTTEHKLKGFRYTLPSYVIAEPNKKKLKKFGLESDRAIQVFVSKYLMDKLIPKERYDKNHLSPYPDNGTIVIYENEPFQIVDSDPIYYYGNTEMAVGYVLMAKKLRPSTSTTVEDDTETSEEVAPTFIDIYS